MEGCGGKGERQDTMKQSDQDHDFRSEEHHKGNQTRRRQGRGRASFIRGASADVSAVA